MDSTMYPEGSGGVKARYEGGILVFYDGSGNEIYRIDPGNRAVIPPTVADDNTEPGLPVLHRVQLAAGANADHDVTLTYKTRVVDAWLVLKGAGTTGSAVTVKNGSNAISDAVDVSAGGDKDRFGVGELDDAQHEIAAGGTLRISTASTGGDFPGAEAYVLGVRVA